MKRRKPLQIEAFVNRREYLTDKPGNSIPAVSTMKIPWNRRVKGDRELFPQRAA